MGQGHDRERMEERFGELGSGLSELTIGGVRYDLDGLLKTLGLEHDDVRPIDAHCLGPDRFAIRYFDAEERVIVAYEFDAEFEYLGECAAHIDEWLGDEYYNSPWAFSRPAAP